MKKLNALFLLILISSLSYGQNWTNVSNSLQRKIVGTDTLYRFNMGAPGFWNISDAINAATASGVTSFNGRTGAVVPLVGDYPFFPLYNGTGATGTWGIGISGNAGTVTNGVYTNGSYANPSWLTSLIWSKITSTPTTLSGYGITDAAPSSGGTGYIQNQTASPQTAAFYLQGQSRLKNSGNTTPLTIDNGGSQEGLIINNTAGGIGHYIENDSGIGMYLYGTSGSNELLFLDNRNSDPALSIENNTVNGTGYALNYDKDGVNKARIDNAGNISGQSFIKAGGTSLQFLKADGSADTLTESDIPSLSISKVTGLQDSLDNKYSKSDANARLKLKVDSLPIETITPTIGGEPTRIAYPVGSNGQTSFPLAIYFHGNGEDENDCFENVDEKRVTDYLLQHGYMVASSRGGGSLWGNQTAQNAYKALYDYCKVAYPGISKVIFIGQSMGALNALNLISSGDVDVDAFYGIYPATNLAYAYNNGFSAIIEAAYGFSGSGGYAAATAGFDPNLKLKSDYPNIWYRMTASYDDTVIPRANNSDLFQAKLADANAIESFIVTHTGDHGDPSAFIPHDVDWFTKTQYNTNVVGDRFISKSTEGFKFSNSSDGTVLSAYDGSGRTRAWQIDKISNGFKIYIDGASEYVFSITNLGIPSFSKRLTTAGFTSTAGALFTGLSSDSYFDATYANTLNFGYNTNGNESSWINFRGYQGGTTQFRDFAIGDGKGTAIVNFIGSTGIADFANSPTVPTPTAGTDAANKAYVDAAVSANAIFSRTTANDTNYAFGTFPTANRLNLLAFTAMTGNRTVDIPAGNATNASTNIVIVKDESGSAGTYTITITPASGTIDGAASKVINTAYGVVELYSNGSNWFTK